MGGVLYLVRHAMPVVDPSAPPHTWPLAAAAPDLPLPPGALLVSSPEPKARQTVEPAGPVTTDPRFGEVVRDEPYGGDFRARRRAYVEGADHPGWEPRGRVVARFASGVEFWLARAGPRPLAIATHGMAMTLWLAMAAEIDDSGGFWADLRLPDVFVVDVAGRTCRRV